MPYRNRLIPLTLYPHPNCLLKVLSRDTLDDEWSAAEKRFEALPTKVALHVLFPEVAKGIPGGFSYAAYNCSDPPDMKFKGYVHHASREAPQYLIKSDKTDHVAIHKGTALRLIPVRAMKSSKTKRTRKK